MYLVDIEGLGPKRKKMLLKAFKSMKNIQAADIEALVAIGLPQQVAMNVYQAVRREETSKSDESMSTRKK